MQELKKILTNAPSNATLVDIDCGDYDYMYVDNTYEDGERIRSCLNDQCAGIEFSDGSIRSIADIKRIVELTEKLENEQIKGALRFKELMIEASNPILHAHIEGVFAVYQTRTSHDTE